MKKSHLRPKKDLAAMLSARNRAAKIQADSALSIQKKLRRQNARPERRPGLSYRLHDDAAKPAKFAAGLLWVNGDANGAGRVEVTDADGVPHEHQRLMRIVLSRGQHFKGQNLRSDL